jgi:DNA-directed RNA polymerase subunit alpha
MLKYRNFGKKSLNEIKDKLEELKLGLGFKFEPGLIELPPEETEAEVEEKSNKKK